MFTAKPGDWVKLTHFATRKQVFGEVLDDSYPGYFTLRTLDGNFHLVNKALVTQLYEVEVLTDKSVETPKRASRPKKSKVQVGLDDIHSSTDPHIDFMRKTPLLADFIDVVISGMMNVRPEVFYVNGQPLYLEDGYIKSYTPSTEKTCENR